MNEAPEHLKCPVCGCASAIVGSLSNDFLGNWQGFKANGIFLAQFTVESIACTECGIVTARLTEASRKDLASRLKWQRIEAERKQ